jgi:mannosyltransferase
MKAPEQTHASAKPGAWQMAALVLIFLLGLALRLYDLGSESIWFDEAIAVKIARMGPLEIIRTTLGDNNPPLYYLILHYWMLLAGDSEFALRVPSALAGALAIPVIYSIGSMLFSRGSGLMAALILSLSAYHIRYSQEARTYSLMAFLGLLSFYFFLKLLKEGRSWTATAGYVVSTTLLMYSHVYGIFLVGAQVLFLLATRQALQRWVVPAGLVALLYVPGLAWLAVNVLSSEGAWHNSMWWMPVPTLANVVDFFLLYSGSVPVFVAFVLLAVLGFLDLAGGKRKAIAYLLLAWLLVPIVVPFVVSHLYRPMLLDRYTIAASPAFYLLATMGIERVRGIRYAHVPLAVAVAAFSLSATLGYFAATTKEPWRDVAGYVEEHARPGDLILFRGYSGKLMFDYYFEREEVTQEVAPVDSTPPVTKKEMSEGLVPAVKGHRRVWLVQHWLNDQRTDTLLRRLLANLCGGVAYHKAYNRHIDDPYSRWTTWYFQDQISLFLFAESKDRTTETGYSTMPRSKSSHKESRNPR